MKIKSITEAPLVKPLEPGEVRPLTQFKIKTPSYAAVEKQLIKLKQAISNYKKALKNKTLSAKDKKVLTSKLTSLDQKPKKDTGLNELVAYLYKNCGNYIKQMQKADKLLFRGMKGEKPMVHGRSWEDRRPKDSHREEQVAFDNFLKDLKIQALRSNSIFTTADYEQAAEYGKVYLIFPLNSSNFAWSQTEGDVVIHSGNITLTYFDRDKEEVKELNDEWKSVHRDCEIVADRKDISKEEAENLKLLNRVMDPTINALARNDIYELLADLQGYHSGATEMFAEQFEDILNKLLDVKKTPNLQKFQKDYKMTDKNFAKALESEHEIYISGEYIAIDMKKYGEQIASELGISI